jgi:hypothetical protein
VGLEVIWGGLVSVGLSYGFIAYYFEAWVKTIQNNAVP